MMMSQHAVYLNQNVTEENNVYEEFQSIPRNRNTQPNIGPKPKSESENWSPSNRKFFMFVKVSIILNFILAATSIGIAVLALMNITSSAQFQAQPNITSFAQIQAQSTSMIPSSCKDLRRTGVTTNGIYQIQPNKLAPAIHTYCDMTSDGGGWTLVASIHENNIEGKCTVGDKWSSEQGSGNSSGHVLEMSGSWENYEVFGNIESITSSDYKNAAYFNLKASDIMIWHVPNDVSGVELEQQAELKYFTTGQFLSRLGPTLRDFFTQQISLQQQLQQWPYVEKIQNAVTARQERIRNAVPDFYSYIYDGTGGNESTYIGDGGLDVYDTGNKVYFSTDTVNYILIQYGRFYGWGRDYYLVTSAAIHPFTFLAWIGNTTRTFSSFSIRVVSGTGADGSGSTATYENNLQTGNYFVWYRAFQVYDASDPSICEVYFHVANPQKWNSTIGSHVTASWSTATDNLNNEIQFHNYQNVVTGYTLLSRTSGQQVSQSSIEETLRRLISTIDTVTIASVSDAREDFSFPISFSKGNLDMIRERIPTAQRPAVSPGYIHLAAFSAWGYPHPLCPGVRIDRADMAPAYCIGGIYSGEDMKSCGDFAGWDRRGILFQDAPTLESRSIGDINSSILIFTRDEE